MNAALALDQLASIATRRSESLFEEDVAVLESDMRRALAGRRVLVVGGAGSIGGATVEELSRFDLAALHVVDLSENSLAELVRSLRGRPEGLGIEDFRTVPLDFGSPIMRQFLEDQDPYDFVLNFAAIKHVRSEKDVYSLLYMVDTNLLKAERLLEWLRERGGTSRYFSVSTDKAANPVNVMGASKRLMEQMIFRWQVGTAPGGGGFAVTSARFANVAFSAGSLLDGWLLRLQKRQPIQVPRGARRYFVSLKEAGQLCLIAAVSAPSGTIVIPRLDAGELRDLEEVAEAVLRHAGFRAVRTLDELTARMSSRIEMRDGGYPLLITELDTSGEKAFEEFVGAGEVSREVGLPHLLGVISSNPDLAVLDSVLRSLRNTVSGGVRCAAIDELVAEISRAVPEFRHARSSYHLDERL